MKEDIEQIIDENNLTPKQVQALCLYVSGYSVVEIQNKTQIDQYTFRKWRDEPTFKRAARAALTATFEQALSELSMGAKRAVLELNKIICNEDERSSVKVTAINALFHHGGRLQDLMISDRLDELEKKLHAIISLG